MTKGSIQPPGYIPDGGELFRQKWIGTKLLPVIDVLGVTNDAEMNDADPDHRELGAA